jgi:Transposase IS116/IS110/IS902 family
VAFDADLEAMLLTRDRRDRLDKAIVAMAIDSEYADVVRRLCCLRGISTLTGFGLAVEIGDWRRFTGATIGAYLGLVPTESSSGAQRRQGSITKTGNGHARRLLVEAAWHHRRPYHPGQTMRTRWAQAGPAAKARGHAGNHRLHQRWLSFTARNKKPVIANVAVAGNWPAGAGHWPSWTTNTAPPMSSQAARAGVAARATTRDAAMSSTTNHVGDATLDIPRPADRSSRTARPAVTNPRISA